MTAPAADDLAEVRRRFAALPAPEAAPLPLWAALADVLARPELLAGPASVVPYLAWAGRVSLLAGREKEGKSTLASAGAAAVTTGGEFLGADAAEGAVLWCGLEEALGDLVPRLRTFGADPHSLILATRPPDSPLTALAAEAERLRPALVVVDTLHELAGRCGLSDATASASWPPILRPLVDLARSTGAAVLVLHHARKDGGYRDSTAIGGAVDVVLELTRDETDRQVRRVGARGRFAVEDFAFRFDGERHTLTGGGASLETRVLQFLRCQPGASKTAVASGVTGRRADVFAAIERLLTLDPPQLVNRGEGRTAALYLSLDTPEAP